LKKKQIIEITSLFKKANLNYDSKEFFNFAYKSIQQREYAKYVFMKGIDKIFDNLKLIAKEMKINSSDLEHVSIKTILEANNNLSAYKLKNIINDEIKYNKKLFKISKSIKLPDLIKSSNDVFFHYETLSKGNYITNKKTSGKIKILKNKINKHVSIDDRIIFTENADPGYEFIFHHKIKGLVTKYGGANSHMSIRCMELGIPAIIGIGENNYNFYKKYKRLEINCETKTIINLF
jgi:phosphoenolpyruvate-protein kinase (PTS system EI component)